MAMIVWSDTWNSASSVIVMLQVVKTQSRKGALNILNGSLAFPVGAIFPRLLSFAAYWTPNHSSQTAPSAVLVTLQPDADKSRTKPFPLGTGHDKFGLGFQIASADPQDTKHRSPGSLSWAGIYNTEFWIDPAEHIGGVQMMHVLPFYDDGAIRTLRDFEELVYQNFR